MGEVYSSADTDCGTGGLLPVIQFITFYLIIFECIVFPAGLANQKIELSKGKLFMCGRIRTECSVASLIVNSCLILMVQSSNLPGHNFIFGWIIQFSYIISNWFTIINLLMPKA